MIFKKIKPGFTLIELIAVIAIIGAMMGMSVSLVNRSSTAQLKETSVRLMAMIRYLYNEAAVTQNTHRLVFDMDERSYWAEVSMDKFLLKSKEQLEEELKEKERSPKSDQNNDNNAEEGEDSPPPTEGFSLVDDENVKKIKFEDDVFIKDIFVSHQEGLVSEGMGYLYFFPSGLTEKAIIHLADESDEHFLSVIVNPITAKCKLVMEYVTPDSL